MSDPWAEFTPAPAGPAGAGVWDEFTPAAPRAPSTARILGAASGATGTIDTTHPGGRGEILPFTKDAQGNVSFDSNAGLVGVAKRLPGQVWDTARDALTLPRDIVEGNAPDPRSEAGVARALNFAATVTPMNPAVRAGDFAVPVARKVVTPGEVTRTAPLQSAAAGTEVGPYAPQGARPAAPVGTVELRSPDTVRYEPVLRRGPAPAPTVDELKRAGSAGYDQARATGTTYSSEAVSNLAQRVKSDLEAKGIIPETAPTTHSVLDKLVNRPANSVASISGVDAARQAFGDIAMGGSAVERKAAKAARTSIEDFLARPDPAAVVAGPAAEAGRLVTDARGNIAAAKRSEALTAAPNVGRLRAAGISDEEIANIAQLKAPAKSIQKRAADILSSPKDSAGFSAEELRALNKVAQGSRTESVLRAAGKLLGGGGGLGRTIVGTVGSGLGYLLGGPAGIAVGGGLPVVGALGRAGSEALSRRALGTVDEMVRMRSPLARIASEAGVVAAPSTRSEALARIGSLGALGALLPHPGDRRR